MPGSVPVGRSSPEALGFLEFLIYLVSGEVMKPPLRQLFAIALRNFFYFIGYCGIVFIGYGLISRVTGEPWSPLERWVTLISSFLTIFGTLLTAAAVYFHSPNPRPPSQFSLFVSAPIVILGCGIALIVLISKGSIPAVVVNGFALLAITGAWLRMQPRPPML